MSYHIAFKYLFKPMQYISSSVRSIRHSKVSWLQCYSLFLCLNRILFLICFFQFWIYNLSKNCWGWIGLLISVLQSQQHKFIIHDIWMSYNSFVDIYRQFCVMKLFFYQIVIISSTSFATAWYIYVTMGLKVFEFSFL